MPLAPISSGWSDLAGGRHRSVPSGQSTAGYKGAPTPGRTANAAAERPTENKTLSQTATVTSEYATDPEPIDPCLNVKYCQ